MDNITHEVRLAHWAEIVKQCQNRPEGMSANTWLKQNGIAIKNYYYWQRRVRNEVFDQITSAFPSSTMPAFQITNRRPDTQSQSPS